MVPFEIRNRLLVQLDLWVEESRSHHMNYGFDTLNGKARFDLEKGHDEFEMHTPSWKTSACAVEASEN